MEKKLSLFDSPQTEDKVKRESNSSPNLTLSSVCFILESNIVKIKIF